MLDLIVSNQIEIPRDHPEVKAKQLDAIMQVLTLDNPDYVSRQRLKKSTYNVERYLEDYELTEETLFIPRGCTHIINEVFGQARYLDRRTASQPLIEKPSAVFKLRSYQEAAVAAMKSHTQGITVVPCGGGKTLLAVALIGALGVSTLVLVHTVDLLSQWTEVLKASGIDPGVIGSGKYIVRPVTVAMVQTMVKKIDTLDFNWLSQWGCIINDEVHHAPCHSFRTVINRFPAKYRFGLSATPFREDGLTAVMHHVFGETVFQIERTELIQLGYLTPVTVQPVDTDFYYSYYGADDHTRMMTYLVEDADRNRLIIDLVKENVNRGHLCLILTGRVEHAEWLADSLTESGIECDLLLGKVKKSERQRIRQKALNGKLQAITATTVADEGLDIPNLSALFMTYPTRAAGKILQRVGRVMRPAPDKLDPVIYDFVDGRVGLLLSQYRKRLKAYDQLDARVLTPLNAGDRVFAL